MTKQMKNVWHEVYIEDGTFVRDIPALVLKWLNEYGSEVRVNSHIDIDIVYERPETDVEYQNRINYAKAEKERELKQLKALIAKHGVPEDAR